MASPTEPRDATPPLRGFRLHYVEWGDPAAPPLVLLHGITGHARTWDTLALALADRWRVLALDQRGHGDSEAAPDGDYTVGAMADDLGAFADALGLPTFSLLGLSMGGRVAMGFAGAHPSPRRAARHRRYRVPISTRPGMARIRAMIAERAGGHRVRGMGGGDGDGGRTRAPTWASCATASSTRSGASPTAPSPGSTRATSAR